MALVHCLALPLKLHHFFEFAAHASDPPFPLKDRAALADHLKISRARVTEWTQGDDTKKRDANMVREAHVETLASLYVRLASRPMPAEEAYRYWRYVSAEVFRDGLFPRQDWRDFFRLLEARNPAVEVAIHTRPETIGMVDEMEEPAAGVRTIARNREFSLSVRRVRGKSVYLLVEAPEGLYLHVPGPRFDGVLRQNPQRIPPERYWKFKTDGPHRIIAIELAADAPPFVRDPLLVGPLSEREIDVLAAALEDPARVVDWNWGVLPVHVEGPTDTATP